MRNIKEIDISKRCGIKPENTIYDFLTEITTEVWRKKMLDVISWKNHKNENFKKDGLKAEIKYTPYLNYDIKDIPEEIFAGYSHHFCTDGNKIYIYSPCCH